MRKTVSLITLTIFAFTLYLIILLDHGGYLLYKYGIEGTLSLPCNNVI